MTSRLRRPLAMTGISLALLGIPPASAQSSGEPAEEPAPPPREVPALASYEPLQAGHPLRVLAYVLHPVGVVLDYVILRPAYWLGSHEPLKTLVGRER